MLGTGLQEGCNISSPRLVLHARAVPGSSCRIDTRAEPERFPVLNSSVTCKYFKRCKGLRELMQSHKERVDGNNAERYVWADRSLPRKECLCWAIQAELSSARLGLCRVCPSIHIPCPSHLLRARCSPHTPPITPSSALPAAALPTAHICCAYSEKSPPGRGQWLCFPK